ncbi:hypothetical protein [Thermogemmatispora tikiterensis]|uniref:Orc1-like AAA ATPase domain-containing protein n=1 Tax=Thermogemmatispora tikiterensis TaxID=1825093 RepID=A0A328V9S2_9CHLR|nr:hypothetical protein [Thermogemmatispora tikiterensis]RAQ94308.1 hypothetical protein A4R35_02110 [Thermogemmatispora tikiterensis]
MKYGDRQRFSAFLLSWLAQTQAKSPWLLWLHDDSPSTTLSPAFPVPGDPSGGFGKSRLLHRSLSLVRQRFPGLPIVWVDGLCTAAHDQLSLLEHVVEQLQAAYPPWQAQTFAMTRETLQTTGQLSPSGRHSLIDLDRRERLWAALARDIKALRPHLPAEGPTLLLFFDHLEQLLPSAQELVLAPDERFPERFGLPRVKAVLVSRRPPDWHQSLWKGRQSEIVTVALPPWSATEIRQLLAQEGVLQTSATGTAPAQLTAASERLRELTGGQPALVQLACKQLQRKQLRLEELARLDQRTFSEHLIAWFLMQEGPLPWWLLALAYLLPGSSEPGLALSWLAHLLNRFSTRLPGQEPLSKAQLLTVPGIRLSCDGKSVSLQEEIRHLLVQVGWRLLDPDGRFRRELSRLVLTHSLTALELEAGQVLPEADWQAWQRLQLLHHLIIDHQEGWRRGKLLLTRALAQRLPATASRLLAILQQFEGQLSPLKRRELRVWERQIQQLEITERGREPEQAEPA